MKIPFILLLNIIIPFTLQAQQHAASYFRLDTIPSIGYVVLDSGWKFHAGDNAEWAKPSLNDSDWQPINPLKHIEELPQVKNAGIGWLRLTLHVPVNMQGKNMTMGIQQVGASEIYLNGKLIEQYGTVSADFNKEATFNPNVRPLYIEFAKQPVQVLAVRYSFNKRNVGSSIYNSVFLSGIGSAFNWILFYRLFRFPVFNSATGGLFFMLFFLQLFLYISNRGQKVQLYFTVYAFCQCIFNFSGALHIFIHTTGSFFFNELFVALADTFGKVFYL